MFPTFSAALGVLVGRDNNTQTPNTIASAPPTTPVNPIVIQMPSFQYPYPSHSNHSNASIHLTSPELPSISEFLFNLDQKYKCNNVYSKFWNILSEEEITMNAIKDLSNEQMVKLEIIKIGW